MADSASSNSSEQVVADADDILIPLEEADIARYRRPRWFDVKLHNPSSGIDGAYMQTWGEWVKVNSNNQIVGQSERDGTLDKVIPFDPTNADHIGVVTLLVKIFKDSFES